MLIFSEDFTKPNAGWHSAQAAAGRLLPIPSTRTPGKMALQVTVWPGDCPLKGLETERNEYLQMMNAQDNDVTPGATEYYALSINLPVGWQDTQPAPPKYPDTWCAALQLHAPDNYPLSPAFQFDLSAKPGRFTLQLRGRDVAAPVFNQIDLGAHNLGAWVDFVFKMKWEAGSSGSATIWRRDNAQGDLAIVGSLIGIPTLYSHDGVALPHYWKSGCYRNPSSFTTQFCRGPVVRATTFEEAAYLAFWG